MPITGITFTLTVTGLVLASLAVKQARGVAALAPTPSLRRAWLALTATIFACITLQLAALLARLRGAEELSNELTASAHVIGPTFVFAVCWLSKKTARELHRVSDLERALLVDPLTTLSNRRYFDVKLEEEIRCCRQRCVPLHLVLLDIDHFKRINDTFGHKAGDLALRQVATLIQGAIDHRQRACRIGGEEFAIIMPGVSVDDVMSSVEQIRAAVERGKFNLVKGGPIRITVSLGAATLVDADSAGRFFERADAALYEAKRAGRNRTKIAA